MPSRRHVLVATLAGLSLPPDRPAVAAGKAADPRATPSAILIRSLNLLKQGRYEEYAASLHPASLKKMRTLLNRFIDFNVNRNNLTPLLEVFGDAPGVEAVRSQNDPALFASFLRGSFSLSAAATLPLINTTQNAVGHSRTGSELFVVLKGTTNGKRWVGTHPLRLDGATWRPTVFPEVEEGISIRIANMDAGFVGAGHVPERAQPPVVVGHVTESKDKAWVVMRMAIAVGGYSAHRYRVIALFSGQSGWDMMLRRDYAGMSRILQANSGS